MSLVTLKIAGILLIFDVGGLQAFDFPKSLFSRAIEWLLVGVLIAAVIRHGTGIIPRTRLHLIAAGFVLAQAVSALFAENNYIALYGDRDRYLGLTFVIDMAVLYLAVAVGFRRKLDWAILAAGVGIASVFVLGYAWIQHFGLDPITWSDDPRVRPFSTLGHPDHLGHFLSLLFGAGLGIALLGGRRLLLGLRLVAVVLCVAALATAAVVATRGTLLGAGAALLVMPLAYVRSGKTFGRSLLAAAITGGFLCLVAASLALTPLGARIQSSEGSSALRSRVALIGSAYRAFEDRPLVGHGPDNFGVVFPRYRQPGDAVIFGDVYNNSAHDWALQTAATTGIFGLLAAGALMLGSLAGLWRNLSSSNPIVPATLFLASVAYWAHALVAVGSISLDWLPWLALGGAATAGSRLSSRPASHLRLWVAAVFVIVCAGASTGFFAFAANRDAGAARQYAVTSREVAVAAGEAAVRQDPGRADYWSWLGAAYGTEGRLDEASAAYEGAIMRAPYDWTNWANLARNRTLKANGHADIVLRDALPVAQKAVEADSNEPLASVALSETAFAAAAYDIALASAVTAITLDPTRNLDRYAIQAASHVTDLQRARVLLEEATVARESAPLYVALARIELKQGDISGAREHAARALQLAPGNADALVVLRAAGG